MIYTDKIKDTLKLDDIVIFTVKGVKYEYQVEFCFCDFRSKEYNDIIFTKLNLNAKDFCTKHYGYQSYDGFWPECKLNDYKALTRVVNALYDEINKNILPDNLFTLD
jgi:hypothetical protein